MMGIVLSGRSAGNTSDCERALLSCIGRSYGASLVFEVEKSSWWRS